MKQIHAPHSHGLRHLGHFPLPPLYSASAAHPSDKVSDQLGWEWKGADDFDAEQFNALVQAVYVENGEVSVRRLARRVSA